MIGLDKQNFPVLQLFIYERGWKCRGFFFHLRACVKSDNNIFASFAGGVTNTSSTVVTVVMEMTFSATPFHMLSTTINI